MSSRHHMYVFLNIFTMYLFLERFAYLNEKYEEFVGSECMMDVRLWFSPNPKNLFVTGSLDLVKQSLADIQLRSRDQNMHHPKLQALVSIVNTWRTTRRYAREKVCLVSCSVSV